MVSRDDVFAVTWVASDGSTPTVAQIVDDYKKTFKNVDNTILAVYLYSPVSFDNRLFDKLIEFGFKKIILLNQSQYISVSKSKIIEKEMTDVLTQSSIILAKQSVNGDFAVK